MFEIFDPLATPSAEGGNGAHEVIAEPSLVGVIPRLNAGEPHKIILPRRPGESRFGPRQYYYPASHTGVVPSWSSQMMPGPQVSAAAGPSAEDPVRLSAGR
jgi:hypothetical protein